jgi:hypothetical protein
VFPPRHNTHSIPFHQLTHSLSFAEVFWPWNAQPIFFGRWKARQWNTEHLAWEHLCGMRVPLCTAIGCNESGKMGAVERRRFAGTGWMNGWRKGECLFYFYPSPLFWRALKMGTARRRRTVLQLLIVRCKQSVQICHHSSPLLC